MLCVGLSFVPLLGLSENLEISEKGHEEWESSLVEYPCTEPCSGGFVYSKDYPGVMVVCTLWL